MAKIDEFSVIPPDQWLFDTHGDVIEQHGSHERRNASFLETHFRRA